MKADISKVKGMREFSVGNYREKELYYGYKCVDKKDGRAILDLRLYASRSDKYGRKYAVIWAKDGAGKGYAGGYGYDKKSAAVSSAIEDAGISLSERIDGVGEDAIRSALSAIMEAYGYAPEAWILVEFYA